MSGEFGVRDDLGVLELIPEETVIEEGDVWSLAVNRNQDLLGKTMVVLRRPCTAVTDVEPDEWTALQHELRRVVPALHTCFRPDQFNSRGRDPLRAGVSPAPAVRVTAAV